MSRSDRDGRVIRLQLNFTTRLDENKRNPSMQAIDKMHESPGTSACGSIATLNRHS